MIDMLNSVNLWNHNMTEKVGVLSEKNVMRCLCINYWVNTN